MQQQPGHSLPSVCSLATFASLMPLMLHSSLLVECARASTVLMPPSFSFLMSAAATPSSCVATSREMQPLAPS